MKLMAYLIFFLSVNISADTTPEVTQRAFNFLNSITETSDLSGSFYCDNSTAVETETFSGGRIHMFSIKNSKGQLSRPFLSFSHFEEDEYMKVGKSLNNGDVQSLKVSESELNILVKSYNPWASKSKYRITITLVKNENSLKRFKAVWEEKKGSFGKYKHFLTQECQ